MSKYFFVEIWKDMKMERRKRQKRNKHFQKISLVNINKATEKYGSMQSFLECI